MSAALDHAIAESSRTRSTLLALAKVRAGSGGGNTLAGNPYAGLLGGPGASSGRQLATHAEQYRHFTGWPFAAVKTICQRISSMAFRVALRTQAPAAAWTRPQKNALPQGLKAHADNLEIVESHALYDALDDPNEVMVRWVLLFVAAANLCLTGKCHLWFKESEEVKGKLDTWPLPSSWIEPVHRDGKLYREWLLHFGGNPHSGIRIPRDQVAYIYYPRPDNPLEAISPLSAIARAVVVDEQIAEAQRRTFLQGLYPGWAVVVGRHPDVAGKPGERPFLTRDQKSQIIHAVKQAYRGVTNYDEPVILDGLIEDMKRLTNSPKEMDFLNSAKFVKERITQGYGVNPITMGQIEGANRASAAVAEQNLLHTAVNPLAELISQGLTGWAAPLFQDRRGKLVCYLEPLRAEDPEWQLQEEDLLARYQTLRKNELRARHHLPPLPEEEGGEEFCAPVASGGFGAPPPDAGEGPELGQTVQRAELLNTVGGIDGAMKILEQLSSGSIARDTAVEMMTLFFGLSPADAEKLIGSTQAKPEPAPAKPTPVVPEGEPTGVEAEGRAGKARQPFPATWPYQGAR